MPGSRTFLWDFFGPNASETAAHFERHLLQFLSRHGFSGETGRESEGEGHQAVRCAVAPEWAEPLKRALRPKRER
jgi:hypothetical protein